MLGKASLFSFPQLFDGPGSSPSYVVKNTCLHGQVRQTQENPWGNTSRERQGGCRKQGFPGAFGRRGAGTGNFFEPTGALVRDSWVHMAGWLWGCTQKEEG